jgi:[acyl-carrier-protein] S-malonyltransferase
VPADLETLKRDLLEQLYKPVRWVESVQTLAAKGATSWSNAARAKCWPA